MDLEKYDSNTKFITNFIGNVAYLDGKDIGTNLIINALSTIIPGAGIIKGTMSDIEFCMLKNRIDDLSELVLSLHETTDALNYFTHLNVIKKYVSDNVSLDRNLQKSIANFLVNYKDSNFFYDVVDWLLKTSTNKLNKALETEFNIAFERNKYYITAKVKKYELDILYELGDYDPMFSSYGGGNLKEIEVNEFGTIIYSKLLGVLENEFMVMVDKLNTKFDHYINGLSKNNLNYINLTFSDKSILESILNYFQGNHLVEDLDVEAGKLKTAVELILKSQTTNRIIHIEFLNGHHTNSLPPKMNKTEDEYLDLLNTFCIDLNLVNNDNKLSIVREDYKIFWSNDYFISNNRNEHSKYYNLSSDEVTSYINETINVQFK